MGDQKRAFLRWKQEVHEINEARKCKLIFAFLESLNETARSNFSNLIDDKDAKKKASVIDKMIDNHMLNLRQAFNKWR